MVKEHTEIIIAKTYEAREIFIEDKDAYISITFEDGSFVAYVLSHKKKHYIGKTYSRRDTNKITWRRLERAIKYLIQHFAFDERVSLTFKMDFSKPSAGLKQWY